MVEKIMDLILIANILVLVGLVGTIRVWQKSHGKLGEKKLAVLLTGYFSFSAVTTTLPLIKVNARATVIVDIIFVLIFWCIGYPWIRWLYRQFDSTK